jgi:hypothetical protein
MRDGRADSKRRRTDGPCGAGRNGCRERGQADASRGSPAGPFTAVRAGPQRAGRERISELISSVRGARISARTTPNATAEHPTSKPATPGCVLATMYHALGIDYTHAFYD